MNVMINMSFTIDYICLFAASVHLMFGDFVKFNYSTKPHFHSMIFLE